ncbi:MAG: TonB-dependent receptor [Alphaproteobacteria bacterium]|nr:TonB-dependent receptor [Alphaproteobacteria bacterium]
MAVAGAPAAFAQGNPAPNPSPTVPPNSGSATGQASQVNQPGQASDTPTTADSQTGSENKANNNGNPADNTGPSQTIIVTGSRIARPTLESPVPVTTVTADDLLARGNINVGDALNELPALRGTFSQANSTRFIGTSGLNILDLRGLGTSRTLVLVNGRRHVTASPGDYLVDVNTIPDELLERVDLVTGGSSAVYGSDAIAGVVNFVLKRNFDGLKIAGQGGISARGDRGSYFGSVTWGHNFADGRGNIAIAAEYSRVEALWNVDRDYLTGAFSGRNQFNLAEATQNEPTAGNGVPDNLFFNGVRNGTIANGGLVTAVCTVTDPTQLANLARCRASSRAPGPGTNGISIGQRYVFMPDGTLVLSNPSLDFRDITTNFGALNPSSGSSNTVGGLGSTLLDTGQLDPMLERMSVNLLAHYDISDAFRPFIEGKFVRIRANQEGQPSFWQGSIVSSLGASSDLRCNNPFLGAAALATLQSIGRCLNPATNTFTISRFNVDFGGRGELHKRDTFRIVGGVEGNFHNDWHYEVAVNYGQLDTHLTSLNNLYLFDINGNPAGFNLAIDAVRNSAGQIVCRINQVTVVDPRCVPLNPFGQGAPSAAALAYVNTTATRTERATEFDVTANLTGNTAGFFELPGGPIRWAVGTEYRRETARSVFDPLTASGGTFLNAIQPFLPPAQTVKEAYGEMEIPIVKDVPFFNELTLSGAARYSDYNTSTGGVWSYNGNVYWAPIHDLRFRGGYSRAVRAPTQSDLYSPFSQNFAFIADPCDVANVNNGTNRAANCLAAGIPAGFVNNPARTQSTGYQSGGNPTLQAEKSDGITLGAVFEPRAVPGLSFTVDYYRIHVKQLIATLSAQTIINSCYDLPSINNPFCPLINRNPTTHEFVYPAVKSGPVNFARQETEGVDFDLAYNHKFDGGSRLSVRSIVSLVFQRTNFISPTDPNFADRQLSELGDPRWRGQFVISYELPSGINFRYQLRYIGKQTISTYEAQHSFQGRPPTNPDVLPVVYYPEVTYHNFRIGVNVAKKFEWYIGVDNAFDQKPPYGSTGTGAGSSIFENVGRYFYSGFRANF